MADSVLSITVRDVKHPCAPYQSTRHSFGVQIFHCDGVPLIWKGANYGAPTGVPLTEPGPKGGRIHGQFKVPPGCYLIRALAGCKNVISDWAYVGVGCGQTVCVNLVLPTVRHCIERTLVGLQIGTLDPPKGEERVSDVMPELVAKAEEVLRAITDKLPPDSPELPAVPPEETIRQLPGV